MLDLKQRFEEAKIGYQAAREVLNRASESYRAGPGKAFAETKASILANERRIDEQEQSLQAAKASLAKVLRESNGAVTAQAREVLVERRNGEDLLEYYRELSAECKLSLLATHVAASSGATEYINAYEAASKSWAAMNVLAVLVECGERVAKAMAVMPVNEALVPYAIKGVSVQCTSPSEMMIAELKKLCVAYEDESKCYRRDLGVVELGEFAISEILTPGQRQQAQATLAEARAMERVRSR